MDNPATQASTQVWWPGTTWHPPGSDYRSRVLHLLNGKPVIQRTISSPTCSAGSWQHYAFVAQLVEQPTFNRRVAGSKPAERTAQTRLLAPWIVPVGDRVPLVVPLSVEHANRLSPTLVSRGVTGSTRVFGALSPGSNPGGKAKRRRANVQPAITSP